MIIGKIGNRLYNICMKKSYSIIGGFIFFMLVYPVFASEHNNEVIYIEKNSSELNIIDLEQSEDVQGKVDELKSDTDIEIAEPNYIRKMLGNTPDDYYYSAQWHLNQSSDKDIDAPKAWGKEKGTKKTVIAVIDTGVDTDHEDLVDNMWVNSNEIAGNGVDDDNNGYVDDIYGWDFVSNNSNPNPNPDGVGDGGVSHGTHVAGIIAAKGNNGIGVAGVCYNCRIMAVQVMNDEGIGTISNIYSGILYAVNNGADIINLSFGSYDYSSTEQKAIDKARDEGVVIVAAAGNDNISINKDPIYPACHNGVIGVGSTTVSDKKSSFSNYGKDCVDVSAPGSSIVATFYYNPTYNFNYKYGYMSGTSMAAPVVAGVAGLLKAYRSDLTKKKITNYIIDNAEDKNLGAKMGSGRVNAYLSLKDATLTSRPYRPKTIKAYTGKKKGHKIKEDILTFERTPYFQWNKAKTNRGKITGYYVYWGRRKITNPAKKGTWKTNRKYSVKKKNKIKRKSITTYYLKVKSKNSLGKVSKKAKTFRYIYYPL